MPFVGLRACRIGVGDKAVRFVARFCSNGFRSLTDMRVFSTNMGGTVATTHMLSPVWLPTAVLTPTPAPAELLTAPTLKPVPPAAG